MDFFPIRHRNPNNKQLRFWRKALARDSAPLEDQFQSQLNLPGGRGSIWSSDSLSRQPEGSRILNDVTWLTELWMIEYVEEFRADLHLVAFDEPDVLHHYHIGIGVVRSVALVTARISDVRMVCSRLAR